MKKHLLWLSVVVVVLITAMSKQVKDVITPAKPVEKSVSFAFYKEGNYASDAYNGTSAMVHITIEVQQNENNCTLHLTQSGYKEGADWDWYYDAVKAAWPHVLNTLKTYLERE